MNVDSILKLDKIPYFLTVIFILISVQFNYTVDKVFKTPILEYQFTKGPDSIESFKEVCLKIKNLSDDNLIEDLHFQLNYIGNSKSLIKCPDIDAIPPASIIQSDPKYTQNKLVYYHIPVIQPGLAYTLIYFSNTPQNEPIISFECKKPLKLERKSIYTWILGNHIIINFGIMIILIIISAFYISKLKKG